MRLDATRSEREVGDVAALRLERLPDTGLARGLARDQEESAPAGAADLAAERAGALREVEQPLDRRALGDVRVHALLALVRLPQHRAERPDVTGDDGVAHLEGHLVELLHPDDRLLATLLVEADLRVDQAEVGSDAARETQEQVGSKLGDRI